ncbi:MAG: hypothetical protein O7G83_18595 [Proteobacteria bacterium]|nr:hypothetical protein [Pseudomonadota bacterium]
MLGWTTRHLLVAAVMTVVLGALPSTAFVPADCGVKPATKMTCDRVAFLPGEYGTFFSGALVRGERAVYLLDAKAGQSLVLDITSLEDNAVYDVFGPSGTMLAVEATGGAILLPESGDYSIIVGGTRGNASYDLEVYVYRAEVLRFGAGATGTSVSDAVVRGERAAYVLGAAGGQTMFVSITSFEDNAVFAVYPPSGPPIVREVTDANFSLPDTGDYSIIVGGIRGNASYDLRVEIP